MVDLNLHIAAERDIPEIISLSKTIWLPTFAPYFQPDELKTLYAGMYNPEKLSEWISVPNNKLFIIRMKEESIGYMGTVIKSDHLWLDKIYVDQNAQGKGIGSRILTMVYSMATEKKLNKIALRVNRRNQPAINFYLNKGFRIDAEVDYPAPNGFVYDDYLMSKSLS